MDYLEELIGDLYALIGALISKLGDTIYVCDAYKKGQKSLLRIERGDINSIILEDNGDG